MRKWVELVAVASCTTHRQTLPDGERGVDSIDDVLDLKLFRNDAAFRIASMVSVEALFFKAVFNSSLVVDLAGLF